MTSELEHGENVAGAGISITAADLERFRHAIREQLDAAGDDQLEAACSTLRILLSVPGTHAAALFVRSESARLLPASSLICRNDIVQRIRGYESQLVTAVAEMLKVGAAVTYPLPEAPFDVFVLPVGDADGTQAAIALFATAEDVESAACLRAAGMVAAEFSDRFDDWPRPPAAPATVDASPPTQQPDVAGGANSDLEHAVGLVLLSTATRDTTKRICQRLADTLEHALPVDQVMLGIADRPGRRCKLAAISGMPDFNQHAPLVKQIEELMAESLLLDGLFEVQRGLAVHQRTVAEQIVLEVTSAGRLFHGPLVDGSGTRVGAWVITGEDQADAQADDDQNYESIAHSQSTVAGAVGLVRRSQPDRVTRWLRRWFASGDDDQARRRVWMAVMLAITVLMIPLPYRVTCETELFPVTYRFVPAPYEGVLKEVLVKPGDVVGKGQTLARMDAQELHWQLAANKAEYLQASKEHDSGLASGDASLAQVAQLEMERLAAETKRLKNRVKKLEITSPVSGIILGGDSEKLEGARIRVGENLFETGPLEQMVAEVYVLDEEISSVHAGQAVTIRLDAFPLRTFHGTVSRISPRAEAREEENVFVAEVKLDNIKNLLRPGMVGRGRVSTGWSLCGWNLLHKPFYQLLSLLRL